MIAPVVVREIGLATIGTFHLRQGDQSLLTNHEPLSGAWGRVYGGQVETTARVDGTSFDVQPNWDGDLLGIQVGLDLWAGEGSDGRHWRLGATFAHINGRGDVEGNLLPGVRERTGTLNVSATYAGAYATYVGPQGWYVDAVALYGWYDLRLTSSDAIRAEPEGDSQLASLETGYPIRLGDGWVVEPQAQIVWQTNELDQITDPFGTVHFESRDDVTGRLGLRLEGDMMVRSAPVSPFISIDWIHPFDGSSGIVLNGDALNVHSSQDVLKIGAGFNAQLTPKLSSYLTVDWGTELDGERYRSFGWTFGLRLVW